jgi:hypothetical protein
LGSLSSRERILKVIRHEIPDRVPVTLFFASIPSFITILYPELPGLDRLVEHPEEELEYCRRIVEFSREVGADLTLRPNWHRPPAIWMGINPEPSPHWQVSVTTSRQGENVCEVLEVRTPRGELRQVKKKCWLTPKFYTEANIEHAIKNERDLDLLIEYEPRPDDSICERMASHLRPLQELVGEDGVFIPWIGCGPFNTASYLRELEDLLMDPYINPDFYHRFLNYCAQRNLRYALPACATKPDMIAVGGNAAGADLVSRQYYDEFILPHERCYIQEIQAAGVPVVYHNCGYIMTLLESYVDMGVAAVESFSPPPLADGDIGEAKRRIGDQVILMGGIDHKNLLEGGTTREVGEVTRRVVEDGKPGGMFILGQADYLEENCKLENIEVMVATAIRYGKY